MASNPEVQRLWLRMYDAWVKLFRSSGMEAAESMYHRWYDWVERTFDEW